MVPIKTSECYINIFSIPHSKSASFVTRINTVSMDYLIAKRERKKMRARAGSVLFISLSAISKIELAYNISSVNICSVNKKTHQVGTGLWQNLYSTVIYLQCKFNIM